MDTPNILTRNMLKLYNKNLLTARALSYHQRNLRMAFGEEPADPEVKRKNLILKVAREVYTNLLVTGSPNPIVKEIKTTLNAIFNQEFTFTYPPGTLDMQIFRKTPQGDVELTENEKIEVTAKAWQITLSKVDEYML